MNKTELLKTEDKFYSVYITQNDVVKSYSNMQRLFEFFDVGYMTRRTVYRMIKERANAKIGGILKRKEKTSTREVKALLFPKKRNSNYPVMRIPFKSYQIMEAIEDMVQELESRRNILPGNLNHVIGKTYGEAFMRKQIDMFDGVYAINETEWTANKPPEYYLQQDFQNGAPFKKIVK